MKEIIQRKYLNRPEMGINQRRGLFIVKVVGGMRVIACSFVLGFLPICGISECCLSSTYLGNGAVQIPCFSSVDYVLTLYLVRAQDSGK